MTAEQELKKAHSESVFRDNPSTVACDLAMKSGASIPACFASAILTLSPGDAGHGTVPAAAGLLKDAARRDVKGALAVFFGSKIPGFGNSFAPKGEQDPIWEPLEDRLRHDRSPNYLVAQQLETRLLETCRDLKMNPAMFTAIVGLDMGLKTDYELVGLFIECRVAAWAKLMAEGGLK